jgi:integrase
MRTNDQQKKPYPDFPLFLHATGQWGKKIRGRTYYFGTDSSAALSKYLEQRDDLQAGRTPGLHPDGLTVRELCNRFLSAKKSLQDAGEMSPRTWSDYYYSCERLIGRLGKSRRVADLTGLDFERLRTMLAKERGPVALGNEVQRVRTLFKFAFDEGLIEKPIRFGTSFRKPSRKTMRKARYAAEPKMIEADELRKLIAAAGVPLKAMILLGINAGFGQSDIANLPLAAIDMERGWIDFPRVKTAILRRCPLWPETVKAIREAIAARPAPKDAANASLVFVTRFGHKWVRARIVGDGKPATAIDSLNLEFQKLLKSVGAKHTGFYSLRHVHRTAADAAKDQVAADFIMGHVPTTMASHYRERIDDDRLKAVAAVVRDWLFHQKKETL